VQVGCHLKPTAKVRKKRIVSRRNPYRKVIVRVLECGHEQFENRGGKAALQDYTICRRCHPVVGDYTGAHRNRDEVIANLKGKE
jgi:hypothetical protein